MQKVSRFSALEETMKTHTGTLAYLCLKDLLSGFSIPS